MLHTKFRGNWFAGSERKIFEGFNHIWAWWPPWSCDPDAANKLLFPLPMEAGFEWLNCFRGEELSLNIMVIYMYIAPEQGQTTLWDQIFIVNINL